MIIEEKIFMDLEGSYFYPKKEVSRRLPAGREGNDGNSQPG
jgi:hypothetical protein